MKGDSRRMNRALVTGGASGLLGPVWVEGLSQRGYEVDIVDLPEYDFRRREHLYDVIANHRTPNIIIHNAAIDPKPGMDDGYNPYRMRDEITQVNYLAPSYLNQHFIPRMINEHKGGLILIVGSIMGYIAANKDNYAGGWMKAFGYNETKRALMSHCDNLNNYYGEFGIRCVMPSFGPYEEGLSPTFMKGFGKKIPVRHPVSKQDILLTLNCCIDCQSLAGEFRVDGGYTRVGR